MPRRAASGGRAWPSLSGRPSFSSSSQACRGVPSPVLSPRAHCALGLAASCPGVGIRPPQFATSSGACVCPDRRRLRRLRGCASRGRHGGISTRVVIGWSAVAHSARLRGSASLLTRSVRVCRLRPPLGLPPRNPYVQTPSAGAAHLFYLTTPGPISALPMPRLHRHICGAGLGFPIGRCTVTAFKRSLGCAGLPPCSWRQGSARTAGSTQACFAAAVIGLNPLVITRIVAGGHAVACSRRLPPLRPHAWYTLGLCWSPCSYPRDAGEDRGGDPLHHLPGRCRFAHCHTPSMKSLEHLPSSSPVDRGIPALCYTPRVLSALLSQARSAQPSSAQSYRPRRVSPAHVAYRSVPIPSSSSPVHRRRRIALLSSCSPHPPVPQVVLLSYLSPVLALLAVYLPVHPALVRTRRHRVRASPLLSLSHSYSAASPHARPLPTLYPFCSFPLLLHGALPRTSCAPPPSHYISSSPSSPHPPHYHHLISNPQRRAPSSPPFTHALSFPLRCCRGPRGCTTPRGRRAP